MYCVKCGVRLPDTETDCPLCGTPVWRPEPSEKVEGATFSTVYPEQESTRRPWLALITVILTAACLGCLIFCLTTYHAVNWSGYVMLGIGMLYIITILPSWFRHPHPLVFVPLSFMAICGYLLYICLYNGGRWFLSFAFPTVMLFCLVTTATIALFRYVKKGRIFITGGLLIAIGGSTMLLELFQHITFGTKMFTWSLYCVSAFSVFGIFLIIAGMIPPLREFFRRKFFI